MFKILNLNNLSQYVNFLFNRHMTNQIFLDLRMWKVSYFSRFHTYHSRYLKTSLCIYQYATTCSHALHSKAPLQRACTAMWSTYMYGIWATYISLRIVHVKQWCEGF